MKLKVLSGLFALALFSFFGCVTEFNAEIPSNDSQILFVDGSIIENSEMTFYLGKSFPLNSPNIPTESLEIYANVCVIGSNGYMSPYGKYLGKGAYRIESIGELDDNVEYGLHIEYDGDIYQSALSKPLHTPEIDSVSFFQPEKAGTVSFRVSTHDDSGKTSYYLWNYEEDWEVTATYYTVAFYNPITKSFYTIEPAPYYYCWKRNVSDKFLIGTTESLSENRVINKQIFSCASDEDSRFSYLYSVIVYQKAISKSAFEYYQNKIVLNDEMGGLFTPQPSELSGNITCITDPSKRVMGFIEPVKNITQKRIYVLPSQISIIYSSTCIAIYSTELPAILAEREMTIDDYYMIGNRPIGDLHPMYRTPLAWSSAACSDCVINGGSKTKPDFWPNNDE